MIRPTPISTLFPYTTLFRSLAARADAREDLHHERVEEHDDEDRGRDPDRQPRDSHPSSSESERMIRRSEEHTSELQSHSDLVCRLLLEKKKTQRIVRL